MNRHERESFLKTFSIFFLSLSVLSSLLLFFYYGEQKRLLHEQIATDMTAFSYTLEGDAYTADIIKQPEHTELQRLYIKEEALYMLFELPQSKLQRVLKIAMPYESYRERLLGLRHKSVAIFSLLVTVLFLFSLLYARYALRPMRDALRMLEEFLKDIIHDLNTPVTSILLNAQMLGRKYDDKEIARIQSGAKTVGSLYKNLELLVKELPMDPEAIALAQFLGERIEAFRALYPTVTFELEGEAASVHYNKEALTRIVDNILSNACKYGGEQPMVIVHYSQKHISITDNGEGISDVKRVFERYYKEGERGLGLGLDIVRKLTHQMGIGITVESEKGEGTRFLLTLG